MTEETEASVETLPAADICCNSSNIDDTSLNLALGVSHGECGKLTDT
jgi:hypothetical protein